MCYSSLSQHVFMVWSKFGMNLRVTRGNQRQKYVGSAGALLPGKFLRVRKVFALNILLSIISGTCLENHWSFWKVSGSSGKFPDCLERFWIVWKVSVLSGNFPYSLESIEGLESFQIFWQVTKLSGKIPECLENFQIVWKVSILSGKFPDSL